MNKVIVYISEHCPYCHRVVDFAHESNIDVEFRNRDNPKIEKELIEIAGKTQVPFLVDKEHDIKMHESLDIIEYLQNHHT